MVSASKLFEQPFCTYHCSQAVIHPGIGCFRYFLNNLASNGVAGLKFFAPMLTTSLVLILKTKNIELFVDLLKTYLTTVLWSTMASSFSFYAMCIIRNQLGIFRKYTTLFVPTVIGMQFCWLFPERVMKLFTTATAQAVFEGLLGQYSNAFTRKLLHSRLLQTLIFMINSAIILHYKRLKVYKEFWFMQPVGGLATEEEVKKFDINDNQIEIDEKSQKTKCVHSNTMTCSQFIWDGIKTYLMYGIPMDVLNVLLKSKPKGTGTLDIWQFVLSKVKTFRPNMTGFFIIYSGIYRLSSCMLRKYCGHRSRDLQHLLAAFLGGSAYLGVDKVSFFTLSTIIAIQALWQRFCNRIVSSNSNLNSKTTANGNKSNLALRLLKDVQFSRIILPLNMGYLVHNFIMNYEVLNVFTRGFLDALTGNKTKNIRDAIVKHTAEELVDIANANTVKMFL